MKLGLQPLVLESETGLKTYNLAVSSGHGAASFYLFQRALESAARPKFVVVDLHPHLMSVGPEHVLANWGSLLDGTELLDLVWECSNPGLFGPIALDQLIPSHRGRAKARSTLMTALNDGRRLERAKFLTYARNWTHNRGALLVSNARDYDGAIGAQKRAELIPDTWQVNAVSRRYLERFLGLAQTHGIRVYLLLPPLSPTIESERQRRGLYEPLNAFLRDELRRFPELTVLDARQSGYGLNAFADEAHLNRKGALALSHEVAQTLARAAAADQAESRWVQLAAFQDPPARPDIEDVDQSLGIVLNATGNTRR